MIIVYGGAFNPITKAHVKIALHSLINYPQAHLYFVPVGKHYEKEDLESNAHRLSMCTLALPYVGTQARVSDVEFHEPFLGTYYTLKHFQSRDQEVYFILGADNLLSLHTWIRAKELVKEFKFLVFPRNSISREAIIEERYHDYKDHFILMQEAFEGQSSRVREHQDDYDHYLFPEVKDYIKTNHLYGR